MVIMSVGRRIRTSQGFEFGNAKAIAARASLSKAVCEALEQRRLLSATITQSGNTLTVNGDGANDVVQVTDLLSGKISVSYLVASGQMQTKAYTGVAHVVINTGAGDDTVRYSATGGGGGGGGVVGVPLVDMFADVTLNTGAGNDSVFIKYGNVAGPVGVNASLGDGTDAFQMDVTGAASANGGTTAFTVKLKLDGGAGNDTARASFFDVFTDVSTTMGAGNDALYLKYGGFKGESLLAADLGAGNDTFDLAATGGSNAAGAPAQAQAIFIKLTGSDGNDTATMSFFDVFLDVAADLGTGNDSIFLKYELSAANTADRPADMISDARVGITGGVGNDSATVAVLLPYMERAREAAITADMGAGNDSFQLDGTGEDNGVAGALAAKIYLKLDGGDGNDAVKASFFDVFTELSVAGGAGNDALTIKCDGIKGSSLVSADMGAGNDTFDLSANSSVDHKHYAPPTGASPDELFIKLDSGVGNDSAKASFFDVFTEMSLDGGAGNDSFTIKGQFDDSAIGDVPSDMQADAKVNILGGDGIDSALISLLLPAVQRSPHVLVTADMGEGSNSFQMDATGSPDAAARTIHKDWIDLKLASGAGNDSAKLSFFDVFTDVGLDMGAGNDALNIKYKGIQDESLLAADMGAGNDTATLSATNTIDPASPPAVAEALFIKFDGVDGSDAAAMSFFDVFTDVSVDLGQGSNRLALKYEIKGEMGNRPADMSADINASIAAGDGADSVLIGLLLPAVQKVREAAISADLGGGIDQFQLTGTGTGDPANPDAQTGKIFLKLDTGAGNDTARVTLTNLFSDVSIDTGAGNDAAFLKYDGLSGQALLSASLGDGNDTFQLDATGDMAAAKNREKWIEIQGLVDTGAGDDTARMSFFDVFLDVSTDLGSGNDSLSQKCALSADVAPPPDMSSAVSLNVSGGDGNDSVLIGLLLPAVQKVGATPAADINVDLGAGTNTFQSTLGSSAPGAVGSGGGVWMTVSGGTGNDTIGMQIGDANTPGASYDPGAFDIVVDGGGGADAITMSIAADCAKGEDSSVAITTGDGSDTVNVSDKVGFCDGSVRIAVDGGGGADLLSMNLSGGLGGVGILSLMADGGAGIDNVSISSVAPAAASPLLLALQAFGGDDNDVLTVLVPGLANPGSVQSNVLALADGGDGVDVANVSPGVQLANVEQVNIVP